MRSGQLLAMLGLAIALTTSAAQASQGGGKAKVDLSPTVEAPPRAKGRAKISLRAASVGKFEVRGQRLAADTDYDVIVGGIKVATIHTNKGGSARARFSSRPRGNDLLLGFDPRGEAIEIRDVTGEDVLTGNLPTTGDDDPDDVTCCIPHDEGPECEDRTEAACAAEGGTVVSAASCLPDPCGGTPPVGDIVCCIPDDSGPECEDRTQAECVAAGGTVVQATSCTPNPCAGTPLPPDDDVQCCIPDANAFECEDRTVAECEAAGGINKGPGTCSPDPCADLPPAPEDVVCCLPNAAGDEIECEDRSADACAAGGGVVKAVAACAPDTCADVAPPTPDVQCCLPRPGGELECEDRTAAQCTAEGGVSVGTGACPLDDPCGSGGSHGGGGGGGRG